MIRQPIIVVLGHVDHGKTTLLDKIRDTAIAATEAGGITQEIGATAIPSGTIRRICGKMLEKMGIELTIPGLLIIDTPGHEAFSNLRKRGGSIADLAVLLIDLNTGIQPQTEESIEILKLHKVPFIIAANKMDMISGWWAREQECFSETFKNQKKEVQDDLDNKVYKLIGDMYERGFNCERFDRIDDFTKQVAIIPISGKTGEGVPELIIFITGLVQKYMEKGLETNVSGPGKGTILEVKEVRGLGQTVDAVVYDGIMKKGDTIVVGGKEGPIVTKIRALLQPKPLQEIREHKAFANVNEVVASAGVKINAPELGGALAGSSIFVANNNLKSIVGEIEKELESVTIETGRNGVVVKTDSVGSLEALVAILEKEGIPIRRAAIGNVTKRDVMEAEAVQSVDHYMGVVFAFNVPVLEEAKEEAGYTGIKVFDTDVIYRIPEEYAKWKEEERIKEREEILKSTLYPVKFVLLPGYIFRQSKPAIVGVEVVEGILKSPIPLMNKNGKRVGKLKGIQDDGENVQKAEVGKRVAVSIEGISIGRQLKEGDTVYTNIPLSQIPKLEKEVEHKDLLKEIKNIKRNLIKEEKL